MSDAPKVSVEKAVAIIAKHCKEGAMSHELELPRIAPPYVFPSSEISGGTTYNDICSHKYPARVRSIVFECADIPGLELGDSLTLHSRETGETVSGQVTMLHRTGEGFVPIKRGQCMISMCLEKEVHFDFQN